MNEARERRPRAPLDQPACVDRDLRVRPVVTRHGEQEARSPHARRAEQRAVRRVAVRTVIPSSRHSPIAAFWGLDSTATTAYPACEETGQKRTEAPEAAHDDVARRPARAHPRDLLSEDDNDGDERGIRGHRRCEEAGDVELRGDRRRNRSRLEHEELEER